jgi:hypothetical protein
VKDLEDARIRGFSNLLYKKLKGVKIEIEATESQGSRDRGQIICLLFNARDLVKADGPYNPEVNLVNTENGEWCERGGPKWTIKTH